MEFGWCDWFVVCYFFDVNLLGLLLLLFEWSGDLRLICLWYGNLGVCVWYVIGLNFIGFYLCLNGDYWDGNIVGREGSFYNDV